MMGIERRALAAVVAGAALIGTAGAAHGQTITAIGSTQVKVVAPAPLTNAKIVRAVAVARRAAVPLALKAAGVQATRLAIAAGLQPGALLSVEETGPSPFGGYYFGPPTGRFGPNRYCGQVQRVQRAPRTNGRPGRVISRRTVTRCHKPATVGMSVTVTYAATPATPIPAIPPA
jgi:hypothetical protein